MADAAAGRMWTCRVFAMLVRAACFCLVVAIAASLPPLLSAGPFAVSVPGIRSMAHFLTDE